MGFVFTIFQADNNGTSSGGVLRFGVQTLLGGGGLYKYEGRTPINVNTGGRAEVMQT